MTDTLRIIAKNGGSYPEGRYADILTPRAPDARAGDEIVADIVRRAGLEVVE